MNNCSINDPLNIIQLPEWIIEGLNLSYSEKKIKDLIDIFHDKRSLHNIDVEQIVYQVQAHMSVEEGTPGGLYMGTTIIYPGKVGNEYFMTRGHYHSLENRSEYYWGIKGEGVLIMMNRKGEIYGEKMFPGSLHYIGPYTAHRVANTCDTKLIFAASWPSDAGHNYVEIREKGFGAILIDNSGEPKLVRK